MRTFFTSTLTWLEKKLQTDVKYLLNGGFWMLFSQGASFALSLALVWAFANLLSQEIYGQYRFLATVIGLLAITTLPGMTTATIRAVAKGRSGIIKKVLRTRIKYGFLGSLGALCGAGYYFSQGDQGLSLLFFLIALAVPWYESTLLFNSHEIGRKDYRTFSFLSIARHAIIVLSTLAVLLVTQDILLIFSTFLVASISANYLTYRISIQLHPLSSAEDEETIPYGKKLSIMNTISIAANELDKIALWYLAGPVQVAVYTIAISLPREISGALGQLVLIALPKMSEQRKDLLQKSLLRKISLFAIAAIPFFAGYIFAAPYIFTLLLPQYLDSVLVSQIASLLILMVPFTLLTQYFHATMHTKALYAQQFIIPVISILLVFTLIPLFGVLGAVWALLLKQFSGFILSLYFFLTDKRETLSA